MSQSRNAQQHQPISDNTNHEPVRKPFTGDWLDVFLTFAIIVAAVIAIGSFVSQMPKDSYPVLLLSGTIAGVLGWGTGILLSPYYRKPGVPVSGAARLLTGLVVGFALAWFWKPILNFLHACAPDAGNFFTSGMFPVAAISAIIFLLIMIATYVLRTINKHRH